MSIKLKGGGSIKLRSVTLADRPNASVVYDFVNELISGSFSEVVVVGDAVFNRNVSPTYYYNGSVNVLGINDVSVTNLDPSVATIGNDGLVTRLTSGICRIIVRGNGISLPLTLDLTTKSEVPTLDEYVSPITGSLAEALIAQSATRITSGMTMAANGKVYSTQDHSTPDYVRNPNLWCADVDLTCISPWNSNGVNRKAGTLITPRHALFVVHAHYYPYVGETWRFVAADGTVHDRVVTGTAIHPNFHPNYPDLAVCTFASDLHDSISPCEVMPSDYGSYLIRNFQNRPPALGLDQEEKALIIDFSGHGGFLTPTDADRLIFEEPVISGDSGNPAFLIVDGELVLITCWTYGGAGRGTPVADYIDDLNAMIVTSDAQAGVTTVDDPTWPNAGGHYQLDPADFSAYPNFTTQNYLIGDDGAGNKSLWVENGSFDGKMSYRIKGGLPSGADRLLYWDTSFVVWRVDDDFGSIEDSSANDVATPDLATFGIYTFTTP